MTRFGSILLGGWLVTVASVAVARDAVGVITAVADSGLVTLRGAHERPASLFAVIQPGEQVVVAPGGRATVRYAGEDINVTAANSPFRLPAAETGDSIAGNMLDWALSVLGSTDAELEEPVAVAMASRGFHSLSLYYVGPFGNHLQRRDQMVVIHDASMVVESVVVGGELQVLPVVPVQPGVSAVDMRGLPEGDYVLHVCAAERCLQFPLRWQEILDESPQAVEDLPPELAALALIRDGDLYQLEGIQQLWGARENSELAQALFARLQPVE